MAKHINLFHFGLQFPTTVHMTRIVSFFSIQEFIIVTVQFGYRVIMTLIYYENFIVKLDTSCRIGYLEQI